MKPVVAIGDTAKTLADAGVPYDSWDGDAAAIAGAGVVVSDADWDRIRAWRVAGHITPVVVVLNGHPEPDERAPFEPLFLVQDPTTQALERAIAAMRASRRTGTIALTLGTVDLATRMLGSAEGPVRLSRLETDLLAYLAARPGVDIPREELLTQVWGHAKAGATRAVDMAVTRLRKKIERTPSSPEHLLTSRGDGYRLEPVLERRTNLGPSPNRFFGRDDLVQSLRDRLAAGRLVTLLGAPGAGKTRLARMFGRDAPAEFEEVWFCDLVPARDVPGICFAVSAALGIELVDTEDPVARLGAVLQSRPRTLLLLDNGEHLSDLAAAVEAWLAAAPGVSIVVTSQKRLDVVHEALLPVVPLAADDARALFLERARSVGGVPEPADRIDTLLERLDRLPLAIELAAARTRSLRVDELEAYLDRRLEWLGRAPYDPDPRHESLWKALAWSWEALDPGLRAALTGLAVFRGGFDAQTAATVLDHDVLTLASVLEDLQDRSLIQRDGTRFRLLESVRLFVEAHGPPDTRQTARERHLDCFATLSRESAPRLAGSEALEALRTLSTEAGNIAESLNLALQTDPSASADLALALDGVYRFRGARGERVRALTAARDAQPPTSDRTLAAIEYALGMADLRTAPERSRDCFESAAARWRALDEPLLESLAHTQTAFTWVLQGDTKAGLALLEEMRRAPEPHPLGDNLALHLEIMLGREPADPMVRMRNNIDALIARDELQQAASATILGAQGSQNLGATEWTRRFADLLDALLEKVPEKHALPLMTLIRATDQSQRGLHADALETFAKGLPAARLHARPNALQVILHRYGVTAIHARQHALGERLLIEYLEQIDDPFRRAFAIGALGCAAAEQRAFTVATDRLHQLDACLAEASSPTLERARAQLAAQIAGLQADWSGAVDRLNEAGADGMSRGQHANRAGLSAVFGDLLDDAPMRRDALADLRSLVEGGSIPGHRNWATLVDALDADDPDRLRASLQTDSWHTGPRIASTIWLEGRAR